MAINIAINIANNVAINVAINDRTGFRTHRRNMPAKPRDGRRQQRQTPLADIALAPVSRLRGVGPRMAEKLAEAGIEQIQDLLFHLPLRYQDRTRLTPLGALQVGSDVVVEGEIRLADISFGRRRSLLCRIQDSTGSLSLRFFHFSAAQKSKLKPGLKIRCYGEVRRGASGLEMYHPEYQLIDTLNPTPVEEALTPVYPATAGITQSSPHVPPRKLSIMRAQASSDPTGGSSMTRSMRSSRRLLPKKATAAALVSNTGIRS